MNERIRISKKPENNIKFYTVKSKFFGNDKTLPYSSNKIDYLYNFHCYANLEKYYFHKINKFRF